jgi:hypothetical protein
VLIQSRKGRKTYEDGLDDLDPYFSPPEAALSLITLEGVRLPQVIIEPAAGGGAIVTPLRASRRLVIAADIHDYCLVEGCEILDYLTTDLQGIADGAVTNPPYKRAQAFAKKMIAEFDYVALFLRSNFYVEAIERDAFFIEHPPSRVWFSSLRMGLPHRYNWTGKRTSDNTPRCWLVWQRGVPPSLPQRFNWKELLGRAHETVPLEAGSLPCAAKPAAWASSSR